MGGRTVVRTRPHTRSLREVETTLPAPPALPCPSLSYSSTAPCNWIDVESNLLRLYPASSHRPRCVDHFPSLSKFESFTCALAFASTTLIDDVISASVLAASGHKRVGECLDLDLVRAHTMRASSAGLLSLLTTMSAQLAPSTLQVHDYESIACTALLPVLAITNKNLPTCPSVASVAAAAKPCRADLIDRVSSHPALPRRHVSTALAQPSLPFVVSHDNFDPLIALLPPGEKIRLLALHGGPVALTADFVPNGGIGVSVLPASVAPPDPIEIILSRDQAKGKSLILHLDDAIDLCSSQKLRLHVSCPFIAAKPDKPLGRLVCDYKNSLGCSINNPTKKTLLSSLWSPINNPTAADVCQLLTNATSRFPDQPIFGFRLDIDSAFNRIRVKPIDSLLLGLLFDVGHNSYVNFPLTDQFGCQDSNYQWQLVAHHLLQRSHARQLHLYDCALTAAYTDDFFGFGSFATNTDELANLEMDATYCAGALAVSTRKTLHAPIIDIIGYRTDCKNLTIGINEKMYIKLLALFFTSIPMSCSEGTLIPVAILQKAASYAIRCADVMPSLLPFSRGFSFNLRGLQPHIEHVKLTRRSLCDLWLWRTALKFAFTDPRWLCIPISTPLLLRHLPAEDDSMRALRQSTVADVVAYADACTTFHGLGVVIPDVGWLSTDVATISTYVDVDGTSKPLDINVLEFIAAILAAASAILHLLSHTTTTAPAFRHVHIWTDNTSCKSWLTRYRANHPLHSFLLQVFSHLQIRSSSLVTIGHIAGSVNVLADAASRKFHCPNGPIIRLQLEQLRQLPVSPTFLQEIALVATSPSLTASKVALLALTSVDSIIGSTSPR